ncbi:MAG: hypothetical protein GDA56_15400 [Hormoscilla sp. GM7CHS1pb]|nr:hypothetical protein [Hormoscilla sp. GM7CHS1pb]
MNDIHQQGDRPLPVHPASSSNGIFCIQNLIFRSSFQVLQQLMKMVFLDC